MTSRDRRDAGWLALFALVFGLVVAPLLHRVDHGHRHDHGAPVPSAPHGAGSLEHQLLAFQAHAAPPLPIRFAVLVSTPALAAPVAPDLVERLGVERPQGP